MSLIRAFATISGLTMVSRVFGLVRDVLTAAVLGAGPIADAFFVALKLPNLFRRVFAEGAFTIAFVPIFAGELERGGTAEARLFAERSLAVMLSVLLPLTGLAIWAMPWIMPILAPGFVDDPQRFDTAVQFARDTFPYLMLMSVVALLGGVLNALERFAPFAAAPILFNASLIGALLVAAWTDLGAGQALAWAVPLAGILQLILLAVAAARAGMPLRLPVPVLSPRIRRLFRLMGPAALGAGVQQVNAFVDILLASLLPVGAISFLYYADRLYQLPLGVIGIAIGTALLPTLARLIKRAKGEGNTDAVHAAQNRALEYGLLFALPAAVGLIALAGPIIATVFQRGAFGAADTAATAWTLTAYAVGVPAYVLVKVLQTAFYAGENTRTPVIVAAATTVANGALSALLILAILPPAWGHVGIAGATAATAWANAGSLALLLARRGSLVPDARLRGAAGKLTLAALAMGLAVGAGAWALSQPLMQGGLALQVPVLGGLIAGGAAVFFTLGIALGAVRTGELRQVVRRR